ncbi:hypothetical protein C1H76_0001 [Elsinoe australis]|uniref:Uncharacterized protein n=1 Tax=Elsinoe australis TaxID=40998 RepID=A0A4U7BG56_9PEZI|nr:hypothetical protein C1H76_0001 [Elsinoe australis]
MLRKEPFAANEPLHANFGPVACRRDCKEASSCAEGRPRGSQRDLKATATATAAGRMPAGLRGTVHRTPRACLAGAARAPVLPTGHPLTPGYAPGPHGRSGQRDGTDGEPSARWVPAALARTAGRGGVA